ncbi:MAG: type I-G CRISPR-associated helicase/endonuclease Cas3g [Candidatus Xenobia bacterium]
MNYREFFHQATGRAPFPYQERLAAEPWPDVLDIPTGLGKTAAIVLAWLWKRLEGLDAPRRLAYCLPMRVLVRQTYDCVQLWLANLALKSPSVHMLMGGDVDQDWERKPDLPAILIGTQDMLLSRALNRGYAQSRYRWPISFSLLNNDCLWLFDETQLMGVGVETGAQLDGLRRRFGCLLPTRSLWMSATLAGGQLETVDHRKPEAGWRTLLLNAQDLESATVTVRTGAAKSVTRAALSLSKATKAHYARDLAKLLVDAHTPDTLTLLIVNTVQRAQDIAEQLTRLRTPFTLLHSRFRPHEREPREQSLQSPGSGIVISTQVVEAGVDISARSLFTELAPWSSLVQRFGRCNRYGEQTDARITWIDVEEPSEPYEADDLAQARGQLESLSDASPQTLRGIQLPEKRIIRPVLRSKDLIDLFDTTPDLSGNDVDVSVYIREGEARDLQVYWRQFPPGEPGGDMPAPDREELCSVPVGAFREFQKDRKDDAWIWDGLQRRFVAGESPRPGQVWLIRSQAGGYDEKLGWLGLKAKGPVAQLINNGASNQAMDDERDTCIDRWVSLKEHLTDVAAASGALADALGLDATWREALVTSGLWHDVGKAHEAFQTALRNTGGEMPPGLQAKSSNDASRLDYRTDHGRRLGFRHELASALAWLQLHAAHPQADLIAYLIAAHHGKVRLSIRAMPNECRPRDDRLFARGVWDGDTLPAIPDLAPEGVTLSLQVMPIGDSSWTSRVLQVRDTWGPFKLAMLETVVRVADWRASKAEKELVTA